MRAGGLGLMADRGWDRPFDDPIPLPRGRLQEPALTSRGFRTGARGARVASRDESLDPVAESVGPTILRGLASCGR
jgi:hypothetical protein